MYKSTKLKCSGVNRQRNNRSFAGLICRRQQWLARVINVAAVRAFETYTNCPSARPFMKRTHLDQDYRGREVPSARRCRGEQQWARAVVKVRTSSWLGVASTHLKDSIEPKYDKVVLDKILLLNEMEHIILRQNGQIWPRTTTTLYLQEVEMKAIRQTPEHSAKEHQEVEDKKMCHNLDFLSSPLG